MSNRSRAEKLADLTLEVLELIGDFAEGAWVWLLPPVVAVCVYFLARKIWRAEVVR